jgi:hypothetical protein
MSAQADLAQDTNLPRFSAYLPGQHFTGTSAQFSTSANKQPPYYGYVLPVNN